MRPFFTISLGILGFILLVGLWFLLPLGMAFLKFEAWERLAGQRNDQKMVVLQLVTTQFERLDEHEIEVAGVRYDVFSEKKRGDSTTFWAFADHAETELMAFAESLWNDNNVQNKANEPLKLVLHQLLSQQYLIPNSIFLFSYFLFLVLPFFNYFRVSNPAFFLSIAPPPEGKWFC